MTIRASTARTYEKKMHATYASAYAMNKSMDLPHPVTTPLEHMRHMRSVHTCTSRAYSDLILTLSMAGRHTTVIE